ncbi:glucosyl-3-phosphoglycerate synthase [Corynebacterium spheniscorum]|uniref:Glucosyl-3-phosphoglycerate synthase n=1 Tax=Corynebacterium spheniscorum TaxID=185761 RepID=A0A1I2RYM0_9CORY|nr:glucosyl-3-phosphoglycerate synthase [Corynebacterium spheniscorum]KAA8720963.1 glucosyl-3-phosphoglycerate synthase [Corynebacterium spheniscorum]SFG43717.1 glucosyl-3-phosphoglycerate synthase [Corynebacterium spheniscorum]
MKRVSVIIPALNESDTIAAVIDAIANDNPGEILVIDADSVDRTALIAAQHGATVLNWREILAEEPWPGKGESLWRGVAAANGEIIVFIDADLKNPQPGMVKALAQPLLEDSSLHMVRATYRRTFRGQPTGGGRVTELTARPLLKLLYPELSHITQPLGGEYALRRTTATLVPFVAGYGVEVGLLLDIAQRFGPESIVEVDLGVRSHRNKTLAELAPMAEIVARTILSRTLSNQNPPPERAPLADKIDGSASRG